MLSSNLNSLTLVAAAYIAICIAVSLTLFELDDEEEERLEIGVLEEATVAIKRVAKRARDEDNQQGEAAENSSKRSKKQYDYERARMCVYQDYLGPDPFFGRQFERIFRITRSIFERLWQIAANSDPFFTHRINPITQKGIYPEVKLLMDSIPGDHADLVNFVSMALFPKTQTTDPSHSQADSRLIATFASEDEDYDHDLYGLICDCPCVYPQD